MRLREVVEQEFVDAQQLLAFVGYYAVVLVQLSRLFALLLVF